MDENNNNLNPNEQNNQGFNNNPYQGSDPYASLNSDPMQNADPYASMNPNPMQNSDPYASMNPDPMQALDPYASMNPDPMQNVDPYAGMNPNPMQNNNSQDMYQTPTQGTESQDMYQAPTQGVESQDTINPILSQSLPTDNANNGEMSNTQYQDNTTYQDNTYSDSNLGFDNNMNYQTQPMDNNMDYQTQPMDNNMNYQSQPMDSNMNYQTQPMDNNMNYQAQSTSSDMDFVKAWMGTLFDKAHSKKFNWPAALFGGIYFLFRKMYLTGALFILLNMLVNILAVMLITKIKFMLVGLVGALLINLALIFVYGFSFYPLYRSFVRKKINSLKSSITDNSQLINTATTKGNTSVLALILAILVVMIVVPVISGVLVTTGIINFASNLSSLFAGFSSKNELDIPNEIDDSIVTSDMQTVSFIDGYDFSYDSMIWFYDEESNSLIKGDYTLLYGQKFDNAQSTFNFDATTPSGRASLLSTLVSSLESQAATLNLGVEVGYSNFVLGTNAYYEHVDITSSESISRYYFILIPEDDVLFQFVLTTSDTVIDLETNVEAVNILTSISKPSDIENQDNEQNNNELTENVVSNSITSELTNGIMVTENGVYDENVVDTPSTNNETSSDNVVSSNVTEPSNSTLSEFLS